MYYLPIVFIPALMDKRCVLVSDSKTKEAFEKGVQEPLIKPRS